MHSDKRIIRKAFSILVAGAGALAFVLASQVAMAQNRQPNNVAQAPQRQAPEVAQDSQGVIVITSGHHPDASAAQLESDRMMQLLEQFQEDVDIIIIDGPPLLIVDSQVLASQVGGILLVVRQANTSAAAVRTMLEQLKLMGVNVLGVVLNRVPHSNTYYYGGYGYFPNGHHDEETEEEEEDVKKQPE